MMLVFMRKVDYPDMNIQHHYGGRGCNKNTTNLSTISSSQLTRATNQVQANYKRNLQTSKNKENSLPQNILKKTQNKVISK